MTRFAVGDRVRFDTKGYYLGADRDKGEGVVAYLDPGMTRPIGVQIESEGVWNYSPSDLTKVEAEPKFRVGDRVKFVGDDPTPPFRITGFCGPDSTFPGYPRSEHGIHHPREIEPAIDSEFKLKPGDRVKNLKTGRVGKVVASRLDGNFVVDVKEFVKGGVLRDWEVLLLGTRTAALEAWEAEYPGTYDLVFEEKAPW